MKNTVKILAKSPRFMTGFVIFALILLIIAIVPMINKGDPMDMVGKMFSPPNAQHFLGTDNFGRDAWLELVHGTRTSLFVGILAGIIATVIGLAVGLFAGYLGGFFDNVLTTLTNMFIVIPSTIILILISVSIESRTSITTALIIGLTAWPWTARAVRAQTSSLRNRDHVNIAKISGYSTPHIIVSEVLPYLASYVVMAFILQVAGGIMAEATVSMLGLGPYNTISLGLMLSWALKFESHIIGIWWTLIPPALAIAFIAFSMFMMNSGMDEVFNPKIRS